MNAKYLLLYHIIIILSIVGLLLSGFSFVQARSITAPENLDQAKTLGERILTGLPQAMKNPWKVALRVWGNMYDVGSGWGRAYILPWAKGIWLNIKAPLIKEIQRRKPAAEQELQTQTKEMKQEIKTEASKAGKSLWQRFKELIK